MTLLLLALACGSHDAADTGAEAMDSGPPPAADADGDGYSPAQGDCDDSDDAVFPGAPELCNGADDDCDDRVDEGLQHDAWYADGDGDGDGDPATGVSACASPGPLWVLLGTDCDDGDPTIHPGAPELCDDIDQDCDEEIDEGLETYDWWTDADGDGWGDPATEVEDCSQPEGTVDRAEDCDDDDPSVYPGADEDWTDDTDSDCDGQVERAAPVVLTGAAGVQQIHLVKPADRAVRVISIEDAGEVVLEVDLVQPTSLVLAGPATWSVEDLQGTVEEVIELAGDGVSQLDDPRIYDQWAAVDDEIASWHGVPAATTLRLEEVAEWPDRQGWPDCDGPVEPEVIAPPDVDAVRSACPDLGESLCLTATADSILAFDLAGETCTLTSLQAAPADHTLLWTGAQVLLTDGAYGSLARVHLDSGQRDRAWLWPEALLTYEDGALLVPGDDQTELTHDIVYLYEGWGALSCGDGANLTEVWAEDLAVTAVSGVEAWWWEQGEELLRWDLDRGVGGRLGVAGLEEVSGIDLLGSGSVAVQVGEELWVVDASSGVVLESVEVGVEGAGLSCVGG